MRAALCALFVLSSLAVAEAQSGAPLHNAGRAIHRTAVKAHTKAHKAKVRVKHGWHSTKAYVGHKARGVAKAIKN